MIESPEIERALGDYTYGDWATESASVAALDSILEELDLFVVHKEVRGYYLQPRLDQEAKTPRIDRLLIPTPALKEHGWTHGPIGIECKRSAAKTGPPLAQLLDYSRAAWKVGSTHIIPRWYFLWPMRKAHGALASILAQHRIGSADSSDYYSLRLASGEQVLARLSPDRIDIGRGHHGTKAGSR